MTPDRIHNSDSLAKITPRKIVVHNGMQIYACAVMWYSRVLVIIISLGSVCLQKCENANLRVANRKLWLTFSIAGFLRFWKGIIIGIFRMAMQIAQLIQVQKSLLTWLVQQRLGPSVIWSGCQLMYQWGREMNEAWDKVKFCFSFHHSISESLLCIYQR